MTRHECVYEADVLSAVYTRRWPDRTDAELRAHVETCTLCADVVAVAAAFEEECDQARSHVQVPDSGIVWWRMQMRARQDATRVAVLPITVAQAVGLAAAVGIAGAVFGATATWFQQSVQSFWGVLRSAASFDLPLMPPALAATLASHGVLLVAVTLCVMIAPIAVYLAVRED